MGILYSRSVGVLSAKGKFIFSIDNDDMFLCSDVFSTITKISNQGNFDIVEFKGILSNESNMIKNIQLRDIHLSNKKSNLVIFQPELSDYPIEIGKKIGELRLNTIYIWNKCVKTNIYKKALNKLGEKKYSRYMLVHEDVVAMTVLFNTAISYKFVGKYGIFHIEMPGTAGSLAGEMQRNLVILYLTDVVIDFNKNSNQSKLLIPYLIYRVLNLKLLAKILKEKKEYEDILFSCLDRVLKSNSFSEYYKNKIRTKLKSLIYINYHSYKSI